MAGWPTYGVEGEIGINCGRLLVSLNEDEAYGPVRGERGTPRLSSFQAWHWAGLGVSIKDVGDVGSVVFEFGVSGVDLGSKCKDDVDDDDDDDYDDDDADTH